VLFVGIKDFAQQITCHVEGKPEQLTKISEQLLGVSIAEITSIFNMK
jgi:hypothetical protein